MVYRTTEAYTAIRDALIADSTLQGHVQGRVYAGSELADLQESPSQKIYFPIITFRILGATYYDGFWGGRVRIWCWGTQNHMWIVENLLTRVQSALHEQRLTQGDTALTIQAREEHDEIPKDPYIDARAVIATWRFKAIST